MKVAIIGSGPSAAMAALRFNELGAHVRVFASHPWLERSTYYHQQSGHEEDSLLAQLRQQLESASEIQFLQCEVKRIHKARLTVSQSTPHGRSRLIDMFRIVVSEDPQKGVLKQVEENPEAFEKLGKEVLNSLHEPLETFYDVDLVIACFDELFQQAGLTTSGALALNEKKAQDKIINLKTLWQEKLNGDVLVVGSNAEVLEFCAHYQGKLTQVLIHDEHSHPLLWQEVCAMADAQWEEDKSLYQEKLHEWRGLEDYMRAKVPAPSEPKRRIEILEDAHIIAVDRLLDRDGLFVTLEYSDEHELMTRAFSTIVNARPASWNREIFTGLALPMGYPELTITNDEPGFYALGANQTAVWNTKASQQELEEIVADVMRWFKPAEEE